MDHNKFSFQNLRNMFPDVESPVTCNDICNRILPIRDLISGSLEKDVLISAVFDGEKFCGHETHQQFVSDKDLRERLADLAFALFLGIESYQEPHQILKDYTPEIKRQIVPTVHQFDIWFEKKASLQIKGTLDRGNLAVTWIYLFAEFRMDLEHYNQDRWFQSLQEPFVVEYP